MFLWLPKIFIVILARKTSVGAIHNLCSYFLQRLKFHPVRGVGSIISKHVFKHTPLSTHFNGLKNSRVYSLFKISNCSGSISAIFSSETVTTSWGRIWRTFRWWGILFPWHWFIGISTKMQIWRKSLNNVICCIIIACQ